MIDLRDARLVGKGSSRFCYVHPEDDSKCIKVYTRSRSVVPKELKYYRLYERRRISWEMMARNYGTVQTSEGRGLVFGLVRDFDGGISKTLEYCLQTEETTPDTEVLLRVMEVFRDYLVRERIIVWELKADNLLYQRSGQNAGKIVLVDGVGNNEFLPIANYSNIFAKRTLSRKWRKFLHHLRQGYSHNPVVREVITRLHS